MGNFFDCVKDRKAPLSDVVSQHRSASVCHLANISMRLGRKLKWDPVREEFLGDDEANRWLSRPQRAPYQSRRRGSGRVPTWTGLSETGRIASRRDATT
jgi:hypothetical protein